MSQDVWLGFVWVWRAIAYLLIGIMMVWTDTPVLPLVAFGVWYTAYAVLPPGILRDHAPLSLLYFAVGWGLFAWIVTLNPAGMMLLAVAYPQMFTELPIGWAVGGAFLLAGLSAGALIGWQVQAFSAQVYVPVLLGTVGGVLMGMFIYLLIRQSTERQALIDQLKQAQGDLAEAERQAGILEERQRLAREIHDTLAQGFTSIVMHLEAAEAAMKRPDPTTQKHVNLARQTARDNLREARRLVWALRPDMLEGSDLLAALRRLAKPTGTVHITGQVYPLHTAHETTLLRIAQEALANVEKHAEATEVTLTLTYMSDTVVLDVRDDGRGFDPSTANGGFGLRSMHERVEQLGGHLSIESEPGEGTTVAAALPLDRKVETQ